MKTLFFLLFLCLQVNRLSAQVVDNQPWCPPGATWLYKYNTFGNNIMLHNLYKYEKDTIVLNKIVKKINRYKLYLAGIAPGPYERIPAAGPPPLAESYYMYNSNDSIYLYYNGVFNHIYSFNLQVGNQYTIAPVTSQISTNPNSPCSASRFRTNDTCTVFIMEQATYSNRTFKIYGITGLGKWSNGPIINKLGTRDFFIPEIYCGAVLTLGANGNLIYYADDLRGPIELIPYNCQRMGSCQSFITSTETAPEPQKNNTIVVFPNPTNGDLFFKGLQENTTYYITVYDAAGKELLKNLDLSVGKPSLALDHLITGLYYVKIQDGSQLQYSKFLKN